MGSEQLHELSAAYALDALDPQEREEFELHLSTCPALPRRRCGVHRDRRCAGVRRAARRIRRPACAPTSSVAPPRTGRPLSFCRSGAAGSRSCSRPGSRSLPPPRSSSASGPAACTGSSASSAPARSSADPQASWWPLKGAGGAAGRRPQRQRRAGHERPRGRAHREDVRGMGDRGRRCGARRSVLGRSRRDAHAAGRTRRQGGDHRRARRRLAAADADAVRVERTGLETRQKPGPAGAEPGFSVVPRERLARGRDAGAVRRAPGLQVLLGRLRPWAR